MTNKDKINEKKCKNLHNKFLIILVGNCWKQVYLVTGNNLKRVVKDLSEIFPINIAF